VALAEGRAAGSERNRFRPQPTYPQARARLAATGPRPGQPAVACLLGGPGLTHAGNVTDDHRLKIPVGDDW